MNPQRDTLGMMDVLDEYPVDPMLALDGTLGFRMTEVGDGVARGEVAYADRICQRFGVVHGGVYAALAEMIATEATVYAVWPDGRSGMGISNSTSFMRPVSKGVVTATATARHRGRTTWVWDVDMTDDEGRLCASSRVTVAVRPRPDAAAV